MANVQKCDSYISQFGYRTTSYIRISRIYTLRQKVLQFIFTTNYYQLNIYTLKAEFASCTGVGAFLVIFVIVSFIFCRS
jgi:hypothetical protein